ncbi:MAG: tetraacyldisaccharide 4'-kinase [Burkholderiaceae bacterium]
MTAALQRALLLAWTRRGTLAALLWPLSLVYGLITDVRRRLYRTAFLRPRRLRVPVVVVGNLVAGGAGKTPLVMALVAHLVAQGWKPGVVSRGFGRQAASCQEVRNSSPVSAVGDEPLMIRRKTGVPVFVAAARRTAAQQLLARYPEVNVLISDDGLQHLALHRDIEICVFDEHGVGNGWLLPAGPLREPWPRPCDLILDAGVLDASPRFGVRRSLADHAAKVNGETVLLDVLARHSNAAHAPLWAIAGIARPEQFFAMLRKRGLVLAGTTALTDHGNIHEQDLHTARGHQLLCTEKDADKLWSLRPDALAIGLQLAIDPAFWQPFDRLLAARART